MKKSNKLLLGGFLTLLLFITAIHVSLYAKFKAGNYTVFSAEDDLKALSMQQYPNILFVSIRNVPGCTVKFGDVAQVEKDNDDGLQYVQKGDTLHITGNSAQEEFQRTATFYLPHNATLSVFNSSLSFVGGEKLLQANPVIHLQKSHAVFTGERNLLQLAHLQVLASDGSFVMFRNNTQVNRLDLQLSNSTLEAMESNLSQVTIVTDSLSRIALPAKQLLKATIRATTPE
ncbi:MAG: hypothetical protein M3Q06_14845 [Bacteroidota bacterium]|nr:hypothetical protein [Bacteroidota bacterium]